MKTCLNCQKKLCDDALFCSACGSADLSDVTQPSRPARNIKGLVFGLLGLLLPSICLALLFPVILLNVTIDLTSGILFIIPVVLFIVIFILAIIANLFPIFYTVTGIFAAILLIIGALVTMASASFGLATAPTVFITTVLSLMLSALTVIAGLTGLGFSIAAIINNKKKLGIAGIVVSSLSLVSVIALNLLAVIASTLSNFVPAFIFLLVFFLSAVV